MKNEKRANSVIAVIKKDGALLEIAILETAETVLDLVTEKEGMEYNRFHPKPPDLIMLTRVDNDKTFPLLFNKRYIMYVCDTTETR